MVYLADCAIETVVSMLRRLGKVDEEPNREFCKRSGVVVNQGNHCF